MREWNGIDSLRMDKYLTLVRAYINRGFARLKREGWEKGLVGSYLEVMEGEYGPYGTREANKVPDGLRYHVLDVWVDELEKVEAQEGDMPVMILMESVQKLAKGSTNKTVRERSKAVLDDERLAALRNEVQAQDGEDDAGQGGDEWRGFDD